MPLIWTHDLKFLSLSLEGLGTVGLCRLSPIGIKSDDVHKVSLDRGQVLYRIEGSIHSINLDRKRTFKKLDGRGAGFPRCGICVCCRVSGQEGFPREHREKPSNAVWKNREGCTPSLHLGERSTLDNQPHGVCRTSKLHPESVFSHDFGANGDLSKG